MANNLGRSAQCADGAINATRQRTNGERDRLWVQFSQEPLGESSRDGKRGAGDHFQQGIADARSTSAEGGHRFAFRAAASRRTGQGDHVSPPRRRAARCVRGASGVDPAHLWRIGHEAALVASTSPELVGHLRVVEPGVLVDADQADGSYSRMRCPTVSELDACFHVEKL
jgi:hypothetical protein